MTPAAEPGHHRVYGLYLVDLSHRRTRSHGIVNYALGLARALPGVLAPHERLVIFGNDDIAGELPSSSANVRLVLTGWPERLRERVRWDHVASLHAAVREGVAVLHYPKGFVPALNPTRVRTIATVHDDIPLRYAHAPWGAPPDRSATARYFVWNLRHALRRADGLTTVSEFSRTQLQRLHPRTVDVTGQGVSLPDTDYVPLAARPRALLHFASVLPHKCSAEGITYARRWLRDHPDHELRLLGTPPGSVDGAAGPARVVPLPTGLSNDAVARELANARALLFPSIYEGFGLPPVEAVVAGTPPVYARTPVAQEVLGDLPGGYEPGDYDSFARALDLVLTQDDQRLRDAAALMRERHDWTVVASRVLGLYRRVAAS